MPTYEALKAAIVAEAEAGDISARLALGDQGTSAPYPVIAIDGTDLEILVGSAWGPALDSTDPAAGPDPGRLDQTPFAAIVRGLAAYLNAEWKPKINAAIQRINAEHAASLELVP